MMIHDDYTRFISQCKLVGKHSKADDIDAPNIPLSSFLPEIIKLYNEAIKNGTMLTYEMYGGQIIIGISEIKEDENEYIFLFEYSNKNASDPFFNEPEKRKRRKASKVGEEGYGLTAHLIIKKQEDDDLLIKHTCVLEEVSGFNLLYIEKALNSICRKLNPVFSYTKNNKKINYYPKIELYRSNSQTFNEALSSGYITQLSAIKYLPVSEMDSKTIRKQEQKLVITTFKTRGEKALEAIRIHHSHYRNEFPLIKVTIIDKNKKSYTETISHHQDLSLAEIAALQIVEKQKINLSTPISLCQTSIHQELIDKSAELLYK